jgi:hypothetical protein
MLDTGYWLLDAGNSKKVSGVRVQRRHRPKKRLVKSKKKLDS